MTEKNKAVFREDRSSLDSKTNKDFHEATKRRCTIFRRVDFLLSFGFLFLWASVSRSKFKFGGRERGSLGKTCDFFLSSPQVQRCLSLPPRFCSEPTQCVCCVACAPHGHGNVVGCGLVVSRRDFGAVQTGLCFCIFPPVK